MNRTALSSSKTGSIFVALALAHLRSLGSLKRAGRMKPST